MQEVIQELCRSSSVSLWLHGHHLDAPMTENLVQWSLFRFSDTQRDIEVRDTPVSNTLLGGGCVVNLDIEAMITPRVYRVYLDITRGFSEDARHLSTSLILKISRDNTEAQKLFLEHRLYQTLNALGVDCIVQDYGLFYYSLNQVETRYFLLLEDGGDSMPRRCSRIGPQRMDGHVQLRKYVNARTLVSSS